MQLGLQVGGLALFIGTIVIIVILAVVIADVVMIVQLLRRRVPASMAMLIASVGIFSAEAYLLFLLWDHGMFEPVFAEFLFVPIVIGLVVLCIALLRAPTRISAALVVLTVLLAIPIFVMWRDLAGRVSLYRAVGEDDTKTATRLIREGVGSKTIDAAFREERLLRAAENVNVEMVKAFLESGADPNAVIKDHSALRNAITSYVLGRYPPMEAEALPPRRYQTVEVLLNHGANPNLAVHGETALETARSRDLPDIVALLTKHGARTKAAQRAVSVVPEH